MARWLTANQAFPSKGPGLCRVCGGVITDGRFTTCSHACGERVRLSVSATSQRYSVRRRDRGVCARCGCDTEKLKRILRRAQYSAQAARWRLRGRPPHYDWFRDVATALGIPWGRRDGDLWDMAHVKAVCDGGGIVPGMTVDEIMGNLETLCIWCHREDTRTLKRRARSER